MYMHALIGSFYLVCIETVDLEFTINRGLVQILADQKVTNLDFFVLFLNCAHHHSDRWTAPSGND